MLQMSENDAAGFELPIRCGGFTTTDCYSVKRRGNFGRGGFRVHTGVVASKFSETVLKLFSAAFRRLSSYRKVSKTSPYHNQAVFELIARDLDIDYPRRADVAQQPCADRRERFQMTSLARVGCVARRGRQSVFQ